MATLDCVAVWIADLRTGQSAPSSAEQGRGAPSDSRDYPVRSLADDIDAVGTRRSVNPRSVRCPVPLASPGSAPSPSSSTRHRRLSSHLVVLADVKVSIHRGRRTVEVERERVAWREREGSGCAFVGSLAVAWLSGGRG